MREAVDLHPANGPASVGRVYERLRLGPPTPGRSPVEDSAHRRRAVRRVNSGYAVHQLASRWRTILLHHPYHCAGRRIAAPDNGGLPMASTKMIDIRRGMVLNMNGHALVLPRPRPEHARELACDPVPEAQEPHDRHDHRRARPPGRQGRCRVPRHQGLQLLVQGRRRLRVRGRRDVRAGDAQRATWSAT